jgi:uncharacterized membrane protein
MHASSWRARGRTTYLLAALLVLLFAYPFLDDSLPHRLIGGVLNVAILVAAAYSASESRHMLPVAVLLAVPSLILQVAYSFTKDLIVGDLLFLTYAIFYGFTISHVLRYVLRPGEVTEDKIHGAIAGYILTGLLWSSLYLFLDHLHPGSFSYNITKDSEDILVFADFLYFSFVTLTTTGYGDIAPVTAHARSLAILEQLAGTFYIAILIARLTSLYQGRGTRG